MTRYIVLAAVLPAIVVQASFAQSNSHPDINTLRNLYIDAVHGRVSVDRVDAFAQREPVATQPAEWKAYVGGITVLRARDSRWPFRKLRYTRRGLEVLDDLVAADPGNPEVRFVRLMSCIRLPRFLKRDWSVAEDQQMLESRHIELKGDMPSIVYDEVVALVQLAQQEASRQVRRDAIDG